MYNLTKRTIVGTPGIIRFEDSKFRFIPTSNCPPVWPKPFIVWVQDAPTDVGHYTVERLMVYSADRNTNENFIGYADRVKARSV